MSCISGPRSVCLVDIGAKLDSAASVRATRDKLPVEELGRKHAPEGHVVCVRKLAVPGPGAALAQELHDGLRFEDVRIPQRRLGERFVYVARRVLGEEG